jgi:carboxyl-terminal processing protease
VSGRRSRPTTGPNAVPGTETSEHPLLERSPSALSKLMTSRTRLVVLVISAPIIAFAVIGGVLGKTISREETYQHLRIFEDVVSLITNNYVEEVDLDKVMQGAMRGLAEGLDADSAFLLPDQVKMLERGDQPGAADPGLQLTRQYYLRVVSARDKSPAARAGLMPGDYVRAIDGKPTRNMSVFEGMRMLRGAPATKVTLTVLRGNAAEPHDLELTRETASGPDVSTRMQGPGIGYVRVLTFDNSTPKALKTQIADLTKGGASSLILDLRGSATGDIPAGIAAARLFVPAGTLTIKDTRGAARETIAAGPGDGTIATPVELLIDNGTSGAAEVFAAALSGNKRAELVGEKTLGRAGVQKLVKLSNGSALWMTATRYLSPSGGAIHEHGLPPDIEVETPDVEFGAAMPTTDPILDKAVERVAQKKAA